MTGLLLRGFPAFDHCKILGFLPIK